jgi:site-specific DNA-methyltransferase (adenine-specific)
MSKCEFLFGDCLELLRQVGDASIDLILCDLPYGTTQCKWDTPIDLAVLWGEYKRIARGAIVLTAQTPFDKVLGASNLSMLKYEWIWEKSNPSGHLNSKKAPLKAHENVLIFYDKLPTYNPQKTTGHKRKTATRRTCTTSLYGVQNFAPIAYDSTERYPRSVLRFASDKQHCNLHPTQKPVALMEYMIRTYSNEGATILDNCMGSGTTGVACVNTGRNFIGIDNDLKYFAIAQQRIRKVMQP